jgi:glycosyltransferase involved in cell wall biosynthesis
VTHFVPSLVLIVPGSLETRTGGYGYDRRMVAGLRERGWSVDVRQLDESFPLPTSTARIDAVRALAAIPDGTTVLVDGLALGALPEEVEREATRLRLVALIHHPLAAETGLTPEIATQLEAGERRALAAVRLVIVTSRATADALGKYRVARSRIETVEPGTDRAPIARGSRGPVLHLLCVATLIPRKGHEILFRALAAVPHRNWRLTCVGSADRDPQTARDLCAQLRASGLAGQVDLVGEADASTVAAHYDDADVFVLPTLYEGYGMAVAEALARGLPIVSTAVGAIPDLVGRDAGTVVPPGDVQALADALTQVIGDTQLRDRLRRGAELVRARLPTWHDAVTRMAEAVKKGEGLDGRLQS